MFIIILFKKIENITSMFVLDEMSWNNKISQGGTLGFFENFEKGS